MSFPVRWIGDYAATLVRQDKDQPQEPMPNVADESKEVVELPVQPTGKAGVPAEQKRPEDIVFSKDLLITAGVLLAVLMVGAVLFARMERWKKQQLTDDPAADVNSLTSFRAMYEAGELSKEEYDRILKRVGQRAREKGFLPAAPLPAPPKESEPPQPNQ